MPVLVRPGSLVDEVLKCNYPTYPYRLSKFFIRAVLIANILSLFLLNTVPPLSLIIMSSYGLSSLILLTWIFFHSPKIHRRHLILIGSLLFGVLYHITNLIVKIGSVDFIQTPGGKEFLTPFLTPGILLIYFIFQKLNSIDRHMLRDIFKSSTVLMIIILFFDLYLRFKSFFPLCGLNCGRFMMKMGGLFPNSNIAGQISSFFFVYYLIFSESRRLIVVSCLFLLSCASFSRVAILVCGVAIGYFASQSFFKTKKSRLGIFTLFCFLLIFVFNILNDDSSFDSKIGFFSRFFDLLQDYKSDSLIYFFGVDLSFNAAARHFNVSGFSAHSPLIKEFLYFGLIGLFWLLFSITTFCFSISGALTLLLITGGHTLTGLPIVFAPMWVILILMSFQKYTENCVPLKET